MLKIERYGEKRNAGREEVGTATWRLI